MSTLGHILVFEQDPELGALFRLLLEGQGHAVVSVSSVGEAQAVLAGQSTNLILIEVPGNLSDRRILTTWRQCLRSVGPDVPALLCSTAANVNRTSAVVAGYEGFLSMPFEIDEAYGEVDRLLRDAPALNRGNNGLTHNHCQ